MTHHKRLLSFLNSLTGGKATHRISQHGDDAIMVEAAVPGEQWEVEFLEDGSVEVEVSRSNSKIRDELSLDGLLQRHAKSD